MTQSNPSSKSKDANVDLSCVSGVASEYGLPDIRQSKFSRILNCSKVSPGHLSGLQMAELHAPSQSPINEEFASAALVSRALLHQRVGKQISRSERSVLVIWS